MLAKILSKFIFFIFCLLLFDTFLFGEQKLKREHRLPFGPVIRFLNVVIGFDARIDGLIADFK
jgi:hypothetical protein